MDSEALVLCLRKACPGWWPGVEKILSGHSECSREAAEPQQQDPSSGRALGLGKQTDSGPQSHFHFHCQCLSPTPTAGRGCSHSPLTRTGRDLGKPRH